MPCRQVLGHPPVIFGCTARPDVSTIPHRRRRPSRTQTETGHLKPDRNNPSTVGTSEYADAMIEQLGA
jgi:hypothetical protein